MKLEPDDFHRVGLDSAMFDHSEKGDTVEVLYSATEDFISLHKISLFPARP